MLECQRHPFEHAIIAAAEAMLLIVREPLVLRHDTDIRTNRTRDSEYSSRYVRFGYIGCGFNNRVAHAVTYKNLYSDFGVGFHAIREINDCARDSVRHLIRVARTDFFDHRLFSFPCEEQTLHHVIMGNRTVVFAGAVFTDDLENL